MNNEKSKTPYFDKLSPVHKLFITEYVSNGCNGTRAYLQAFAKKKTSTAAVESSKLLKKPNISKARDEKLQELIDDKEQFTRDMLKIQLKTATSDITDYIKYDSEGEPILSDLDDAETKPIKSISITKGKFGNSVKVELYDKNKAIDSIAKLAKLIDDKSPLEGILENSTVNIYMPENDRTIKPKLKKSE